MTLDPDGLVYRLTSPSGKKYIGITYRALSERMADHCKSNRTSRAIHAAIKKYGFGAFLVEIVFTGKFSECKEVERSLIHAERTRQPFGYNLTDGGDGVPGLIVGPETRAKLSAAASGKKQSAEAIERRRIANTGKKRSDEFRAALGARKRGRVVSDETRIRLSVAGKKRASDPAERERLKAIGTRHSQEVIEKIRIANTGRKQSAETISKRVATQGARRQSPEYRLVMSEIQRARKASPEYLEYRLAMSEKMRVVWALRKAQRTENV